jgi:cyanobactin maturation PatA/PatG family protease
LNPIGHLLGIEPLWSMTRGDPRVVIAVLDGPVETEHACLSGARLELVALASAGASGCSESRQHGTHVISQIFANSECGLSGIAPECSGLLIPVFGGTENGGLIAASQIDLARAIRLAVDRGSNIINISGGQLSATPEAEQFLGDALVYCDQAGVLVVAAAGNNGCECLHVPASIASVLAVGAFDPATGKPMGFSNWGRAYRSNGILAPGMDMPGAQAGGGLTTRTGTSFAAPIVTGVAALLMSVQLNRGMAVDARTVRAALLKGATRCDESVAEDCRPYLVGKLDVNTSLGLLCGEVDAVEPLQAAAALHACGQEAMLASCDVSRDGISAAEIPNAGFIEASSARKSSETRQSNLAEVDAMRAQSVPLSSAIPGRRFVEAGATKVMPSASLRNWEEENMVNERIDTGGDQPSGDAVESTRPAGIEASGIAVQEGAADILPSGVKPSSNCGCGGDCGCGCGGATGARPQLVFALGELGYDLVTEARKDSLWQAMGGDPHEWGNLARHLQTAPWDAEAVTWTLRIDATPIYAIRPMGAYAPDAYKRLADWLIGQTDERKIERVSLPGWIAGSATLTNGIVVPVVVPSLRGMFAWDTRSLVGSLTQDPTETETLTNFLERVYYELRNLGQSPQERAMNFAATNAYQAHNVFQQAVGSKTQLDHIHVVKSPICRQDSDCWDVMLTFFDPLNDRAARMVHRFTVDVSDVVPCTVGRTRNWFIR